MKAFAAAHTDCVALAFSGGVGYMCLRKVTVRKVTDIGGSRMPAKKLYKVILESDEAALELRVSREIKDGWMPCGGVTYRPNPHSRENPAQAVWGEE